MIEFFERLLAVLPKGVAIGFNTSHYVVNLLFAQLDHRLRKYPRIYIFRYMDDILIFCPEELKVSAYQILKEEMDAIQQTIKPNLQFAPVTKDIHFCGIIYGIHGMKLSHDIVTNIKRKDRQLRKLNVPDDYYKQQMASYWGWCKHTNSIALWKSILKDKCYLFDKEINKMKQFSDIATGNDKRETYTGKYFKKGDIINKEVQFLAFREITIKKIPKIIVKAIIEEEEGYFFTESEAIWDKLKRYQEQLPFQAKVIEIPNRYGQLFMTLQ